MSQARSFQFIGRLISSGEVTRVETDDFAIRAVDDILNVTEVRNFISPGFIDLQVNGFAGVDYNNPDISVENIASSIRAQFATGVTKFLPTIITGPKEEMVAALRNLTRAADELERNGQVEARAIAGYHMEGPHLSPEDGPRGAHPLEHIRPPDPEEFRQWQEASDGRVKLVTISPEWPAAADYVRTIVRGGVVASIGHTKATTDQIQAAIDAGARMSTHLGNAAHAVLPKTKNYIWDQLASDQLSPSFIVDGFHIPANFLAASIRSKGVENCILVTDAVAPAMCPPGNYRLGRLEVELKSDGRVVLQGGNRLAGSALRMDAAVSNAVKFGRVSLREAILMATQNAARVGRIGGRQRGIVPGEKADLILFEWDAARFVLTVQETVVAGTSVYKA